MPSGDNVTRAKLVGEMMATVVADTPMDDREIIWQAFHESLEYETERIKHDNADK